VPAFEALWDRLRRQTSRLGLAYVSHRIDQFVFNDASALFLCAPQALYAVNQHVDFAPYRTTFELADTAVGARGDEGRWWHPSRWDDCAFA
jgi:peptide/nickel transport system substrate-binding protein